MAVIPLLELLAAERRWWGERELAAYYGADVATVVAELQFHETYGRVTQARPLTLYDTPRWGIDMRGMA